MMHGHIYVRTTFEVYDTHNTLTLFVQAFDLIFCVAIQAIIKLYFTRFSFVKYAS